MTLKSLDPRLRGDDDRERRGETDLPRPPPAVMPAKAGIQGFIATQPRFPCVSSFRKNEANAAGYDLRQNESGEAALEVDWFNSASKNQPDSTARRQRAPQRA